MKTLFPSKPIFTGSRSGTLKSPDGLLDVELGAPLPFAEAYSACYHGALVNAARRMGSSVDDSAVRASVSLVEDDSEGDGLAVEMHALLPGVDPAQALRIMDAAHQTCPYSKALRGEASFALVVD